MFVIFLEFDSKSKVAWQNKPVPLPHIHGCHLLNYERQLPSVILSHCRYSLQVGKGQDVSYDWPALEKDILGRFIHGKPLIQTDIPQVVYRKDIYTAATFAAVRKKVEPQVGWKNTMHSNIIMSSVLYQYLYRLSWTPEYSKRLFTSYAL